MSEQLDGLSMNIEETNKDKLRQVFPECFTEGKLDIDKLLSLCGEYMTDDFERYEFKWKGKSECLQLAQKRSTGTLRPCVEESVNWENTKNLYIEGDNLEVLKLLQRMYYHKVKMIYIDPPYNTGNDFVYEDDFKDPLERYREVTSQTTKSNPETMGRFHTNWLNMMYPRLRLAANLLREDGVCFISIDDNEIHNLRKLCDEVFGEENYVGVIIWKNATDNNPTRIAMEHEYIICYTKRREMAESVWKTKVSGVKNLLIEIGNELNREYEDEQQLQNAYTEWYKLHKSQLWPLDRYKYIDKGGVYTGSQSVHNPGRDGYRYDIIHPITGQACMQPLMGYRFPETTMHEMINNGKILFGENHNKIVEIKIYAKDYEEKLSSIFELDGRLGSYDLKTLFGDKPIFSNPKPIQLIQRLLSFITESDDIIVDFFAGSATLAQATIELNNIDKKRRKFICVQLPENLDKAIEAADQKAKAIIKNAIKFLDSISKPHYLSEIGKERIRRAGRKILEEWEEKQKQLSLEEQKQSSLAEQGWEEAQKQISLMEENQEEVQKQGSIAGQNEEEKPKEEQKPTPPDIGFRVFKLDTSNCKVWDNSPVPEDNLTPLEERLKNMTDRIKPGRTDLDMVFEIMLKLGIPLTDRVIPLDISGKRAYSIWENCLVLVCLEKDVTLKQLEEMADYAPAQMVFAQDSFDGSVGKVNAEMTLQRFGIELKFL